MISKSSSIIDYEYFTKLETKNQATIVSVPRTNTSLRKTSLACIQFLSSILTDFCIQFSTYYYERAFFSTSISSCTKQHELLVVFRYRNILEGK